MGRTAGLDDQVTRSPDPVFTEVDGEVVLLSVAEGSYYQVGPVGSVIWSLLETPRSVRSLCDLLRDRYEVDEEACRRDVLAFLEAMVEGGLVLVEPRG